MSVTYSPIVTKIKVSFSQAANDLAASNAAQTALDRVATGEDRDAVEALASQINPQIQQGLTDISDATQAGVTAIDNETNLGLLDLQAARDAGVQAVENAEASALQAIGVEVQAAQTARQGAEDAETRIEGIEQNVIFFEGQAQGAANTAIQSNTDTQALLVNFFDPAIIALNSRIVADGGTVVIKLRFVQQELDLLTA
jgi:hypothetical protein